MEKRRRQRKKTHLPTRFGVDRPERLGLITNVSTRGVYLSTNSVLPSGSMLHLQVKAPSGYQILLQGRVLRSRRVASSLVSLATGGMAVQLREPPANWRESLALPEDA